MCDDWFGGIDPRRHKKTGQILNVADLACEYGFSDVDGRQPPQMYTLRFYVESFFHFLLYRLYGPKKWAGRSRISQTQKFGPLVWENTVHNFIIVYFIILLLQ